MTKYASTLTHPHAQNDRSHASEFCVMLGRDHAVAWERVAGALPVALDDLCAASRRGAVCVAVAPGKPADYRLRISAEPAHALHCGTCFSLGVSGPRRSGVHLRFEGELRVERRGASTRLEIMGRYEPDDRAHDSRTRAHMELGLETVLDELVARLESALRHG